MASFAFFIVTTFQIIWACHVTCVYKLAKNFISRDTLLNYQEKSPNMNLIPALVQELLKIFVGGGPKKPPSPVGIGLVCTVYTTEFK